MIDIWKNNYFRITIKATAWIAGVVLGLVIALVIALQFSYIQHYILHALVSPISDRTQTRIDIRSVSISPSGSIVLKGIFIEGRQRDTLLSVGELSARISVFGLLSRKIAISDLHIDSLTAHVTRTLPDSAFNFDFLINAMSVDDAGSHSASDTSESSGWTFGLSAVSLRGISTSYDDDVSGSNVRVHLGALDAAIDEFDIIQQHFRIGSFSLTNMQADVIQSKDVPSATSSSPSTTFIGVGACSLENVHAVYEKSTDGTRYTADIGASSVSHASMNLASHHFSIRSVVLDRSSVRLARPTPDTIAAAPPASAAHPWDVQCDTLRLRLDRAQYDVIDGQRRRGFDVNHVLLREVEVDANQLSMGGSRAAAHLTHASCTDHSGLHVRDLSFSALVDSVHAQVTGFRLETPSTTIHQRLLLSYPSLSSATEHPGDVKVHMTMDDTHLGVPDLLLFVPSLPIARSDRAIAVGAVISGSVNDMQVESITAHAGDSSAIDMTGSIRGLPEMNNATYAITVHRFSTGRNDMRMFVSDTLLPKMLAIPSFMTMSGTFTGSMKDFTASASLWTTIGSISARASLAGGGKANAWTARADIDNFDVGALLNDTSALGPVTLTASAEGSGLTKNDITGHIVMTADKVTLLGYPYRNLSVEGTAGAERFDGTIGLRDSNLVLLYSGLADIGTEHPAFKFSLDCKGADLRRLGVSDDDMRVSGTLSSDLTRGTVNDVSGHVDVRNVAILKNGKRFIIDSLLFVSEDKDHATHVSLTSPILDAQYDGTIALSKLPDALRHHLRRYFSLHDTAFEAPADSQSFTFSAELKEQAALAGVFFPAISRIDAGAIHGAFNSMRGELDVELGMNSLAYNEMTIDSLLFTVSSDSRRLRAALHVGTAAASQLMLTNCDVNGTVEHDSIDVSVRSTDRSGDTKLLLAGIIKSVDDGYQFHMTHDGVIFDNRAWNVPADNSIRIGKGLLVAHHMVLSDTGQALSLQSADESQTRSPLKIEFSKFRIATLTQLVARDSGFAAGIIDGTIELRMPDKTMAFTSDLSIADFVFGRMPVGDLALHADNRAADIYNISMNLTGNGNRVGMQGTYRTGNGAAALDLAVDVGTFNLASIEPFTFGTVTHLTGTMTGALHITGAPSEPSLAGTLKFGSTGFTPTLLNSHLRLNSGQIGFDERGIDLQALSLVDSLGNTASIGGYVTTSDYKNFGLNLSVRTKNFLLLNKPPDPRAMYYGTVFIDSDVRVNGTQTRPVIDVQATLNKGTAVTFVLPASGPDVQGQEGIVSFVDRKHARNPIMKRATPPLAEEASSKNTFGGIDLTSNIEVTKDTKLQILVDPVTGDSLVVQGNATLSVGMYPSGILSVTGRYDITGGSYLASFNNLLKREFKIQKGSSLTWFGSPFDANVDITAVYTVKTSALDLVKDQIAGMSQEERTKYRQELPIEVFLEMKGRLLAPEIKFKIDLPEDQRGALGGSIYAKLSEVNEQDSELNKQVFALLVLGRFVPSDPLALAGEGNGLTGLARSSVSSLLASQLNSLSQKYVKGVDVNVGLESGQDYSTGTAENRTQLQLALSKSLFEERLTFQVGGNVDLEGPRSQQNSLNNFSGDIKVGYKLTEDGRWQMQVFRQRAYEGLIEGDLIETGVGLVFTIDYDTLVGLTLKPADEHENEGTK